MLRRWLFLMAVVMLTVTASGAFAQVVPYEIRYFGNVAPDAAGSCGQSLGVFYQFQLDGTGNTALGSVVADAAATDGWAYRINDNSATDRLKWRTNAQNIDQAAGATIVARVKTVSDTNGLANIGILGSNLSAGFHWGGANGIVSEPCRAQSATVSGNAAYHILRLTSQGAGLVRSAGYTENFTYANGNLVGLGGIPGEAGTSWQGNAGTEISVVGNEMQVFGGTHNTSAVLPCLVDPDVNGKITIIVKSKPIDGADGWVYTLNAVDTKGVTVAGWMAAAYSEIKGRVGAVSTPLYPAYPAKLSASYSMLKIVIDTTTQTAEYFVDNGTSGTYVSLGSLPFSTQVTGRKNRLASLQLTSFNDGRTATCSWFLDDLALAGTHVSGRTVNLYVDENPTPALSVIDAVAGAGANDSFMMGSASPCATDNSDVTAQQDVYIDWISATAAGAFAPGQEKATLGHSLVVNTTCASTIAAARTAAANQQVKLTGAYVTAAYWGYDAGGNSVPVGFAVVDGTGAPRGIRVVDGGLGRYLGEIVDVGGSVVVEGGEPVLYANYVTDVSYTPESDPILRPYGMNGKSSGGAMLPTTYSDNFTYSNGAIAGNGGWLGSTTSTFSVDTNTLKVKGGLAVGEPESITLKPAIAGGDTTVSFKVKSSASNDRFCDVYVTNGAGNELAHWWIGGGIFGTKVRGNAVGPQPVNLTGGWDTIKAVIDPINTTIYLNNTLLGSGPHDGGSGVASIIVGSGMQNAMGLATETVSLDDLNISVASADNGISTMGVRTTLCGVVTRAISNPSHTWDGGFYIDDGSGLYDGNTYGATGIFCRSASSDANGNFHANPYEADFVSVTGIMGVKDINGKKVRYFWTWDFNTL